MPLENGFMQTIGAWASYYPSANGGRRRYAGAYGTPPISRGARRKTCT